jgi:UDP:flavonoid glycosyltransferase YjiC (YdhE family)
MPRPAVVFCMPDASHFRRLRSLISGLAGLGMPVHVFTGAGFRHEVEEAGGTFVDLFARSTIAQADDESMPMPCRLVSYAGMFAGEISGMVAALEPSVIVHDTFAVIGWVVADYLGIPRVNVCAGHDVDPARFIAALATDPRVRISPRCHEAVDLLRTRYGVSDASPFSYVGGLSRDVNLYCEPAAFLDEEQRRRFEPMAFYGSLPDACAWPGTIGVSDNRGRAARAISVYICFGTVVWRYYKAEALRALSALASWFARQPHVRVTISLGGTAIDEAQRAALARPNVSVETSVDQWAMLAQSDLFITHHGLNSTHEAIFHRVPMISYPFFWDQPALADKCRAFGLAIPLTDTPRGEVTAGHVQAAWQRYLDERENMRAALSTAREWELAVIAQRPAVLERIRHLCGRAAQPDSAATARRAASVGPSDPGERVKR